MGYLRLGTAKVDITPPVPVELAGFASRSGAGACETVSHRLHANIFVFCTVNAQGRQLALLVSADLPWWGPDRVESLRRTIGTRWGLDPAAILLHATHTHSGPQTSFVFSPLIGLPDAAYIEELERRLLDGIRTAIRSMEPVEIEIGQGECRIGIHRRKRVNGRILLAPDENGPADPEVRVIRFRRLYEGETKAVLVHYACHPTVSSDNRISSDFCGVAMAKVERELGPQAMVAYLQGCCGDIAPLSVKDGAFVNGQEETTDSLGGVLAAETLRILRQPMKRLDAGALRFRSVTVALPLRTVPTLQQLQSMAADPDEPAFAREWSRLLLERKERLQPTVPLEIALLSFADGLSVMAMNAEMVVEYGKSIKRGTAGSVLPVAYTNGMIGYVPTASQLREGGYEVNEALYYYGLPAPLRLESEILVKRGIEMLLGYEWTDGG